VTGEGQFLSANDTARLIVENLGNRCALVELDAKGKDCGQVIKELKAKEELGQLVANKAVLVGNAVVVRNIGDMNSSLGMYLCHGHEKYSSDAMAKALGYETATELTHAGVDLLGLTGREHGYMSFVLASIYLKNVKAVVVSEGFWKKAYRESTLLGCDIGNGFYLAGEGKGIIDTFMDVKEIIKERLI